MLRVISLIQLFITIKLIIFRIINYNMDHYNFTIDSFLLKAMCSKKHFKNYTMF